MIRRPPRSTLSSSSAASDVYKRQYQRRVRDASPQHMATAHQTMVTRGVLRHGQTVRSMVFTPDPVQGALTSRRNRLLRRNGQVESDPDRSSPEHAGDPTERPDRDGGTGF
eukprot:TRINITY_DN1420_c0_g1_i6.p1 TRINITY_DN1420_c0_g1~~TRINITY_DN1420_c0_g1_i6.p1  ORF type:complete len:111 (-),score=21.25 TRINITY_DN1420_c0_g1_i6:150-482(-)